MAAKQMKIAIIGGGIYGIGCIICLKEDGHEPVCFEATDKYEGTMCDREESTEELEYVMPTTVLNNSKELRASSILEPRKENSCFPRHKEDYQYLGELCKHFNCEKHICFNSKVIHVKKNDDYKETGRLLVNVRNETTGNVSSHVFDGVMIAAEQLNIPKFAKIAGQEKFKGKVMHTHDLKGVQKWKGKNVLVIGSERSALDVAVDASSVVKNVFISCRPGSVAMSRSVPFCYPTDWILARRYMTTLSDIEPQNLLSSYFMKIFLDRKFDERLYHDTAKYPFLTKNPVVNEAMRSKLLLGSIVQKSMVKNFLENGVVLDGEETVTEIDDVIFATGYNFDISFLEKGLLEIDNERINLYKCMYPPQLPNPTLLFIGLINPLGPAVSLVELQIRWAAHIFSGKGKLPPEEVMINEIIKRHKQNELNYAPSEINSIRVEFSSYMYDIASEIGVKHSLMNSHLLKSVYSGDLTEVEKLLKEGADINIEGYIRERNYNLYTPLILAAEENYVELSEALLRNPNINVNQNGNVGCNALHKASIMGHADIVKFLLEKLGIYVNAETTQSGCTPLHLAACRGHEEVVEMLLQAPGILVNKKDKYGRTALHRSGKEGHRDVVEMLLNVPGILVNEKENIHNETPLHLAVNFGYSNVVEALLNHLHIDVNVKDKYNQTPLHTSAFHGNLRVVEMLLKAGINVNEKTDNGFTAVQWAAKKGHVNIIEMIINHIKHAGITQCPTSIGVLGRHEGSRNKVNDLNEQLLVAAKNGDLGKVEKLLKNPGIDVNCRDRYKRNTPLHLASVNGHVEVVKALLRISSIQVNAKNKDNSRLAYPIHPGDNAERQKVDIGKTALYLAVSEGHHYVVEVLVNDRRTDVNAEDKYGESTLHLAIKKHNIEIVEVLLKHPKINVNARDMANDHFTPLHSAVDYDCLEIVKILLNHPNINLNLKDKFYKCTPLELAKKRHKLKILEVILNHQ